MKNFFSKNMSDEKKDNLFLDTCSRFDFDTNNDVLVDLVVELAAEIKEFSREHDETLFNLMRKIEYKSKEVEYYKSIVYKRQKQKDKIRDINIITINNNYNNTFNSFGAEDGDDECGTEETMDQA